MLSARQTLTNKEGVDATREVLLERNEKKKVGTEFLVRILKLILENNIMEFNEEYFRQDIGAPMGSGPVPPYANIFMAKYIDPKLLETAQQFIQFTPQNISKASHTAWHQEL